VFSGIAFYNSSDNHVLFINKICHKHLYVHSIKMPTKGQFSSEKNVKMLSSRDDQNKGHSQHDQVVQVQKDRAKAVNRNVDGKFEDRVRVVKNDKFRRQREPWNTEMKGSKPWPGRKATTVDELVKHMSNVPSYLQHKGSADHLQDKALNVGVLEWGLLANWSQQNHEASRSNEISPSNTSRSMLLSSPSHSSASPSSRCVESNQSSPMSDHQHSSSKEQQSRLADEHSGKARYSPSPNSAVLSLLPGHGKYLSAENSCDHGGPSVSNVSLLSDSVATSSGSCVQRERDENKESRGKIEDAVHHCSRRLFTGSDNIGNKFFTSDNNDYMCNGPEHSIGLNGEHLESLISNSQIDTGRNSSRSPYGFLEDIEPSQEFPRFPYSCPLPIIDSADEVGNSGTAARINVVDTSGTTGKNFNKNQSAMRVTVDRPQSSGKFSDVGRMPDRHLVSGMNRVSRSCSLKEVPYARQLEVATSVDKTGDRLSSNSKGNRSRSRSPLRRMLDPILKPKQTSTSSPIRPSFVPKCRLPGNTSKQSLDFKGSVSQNVHRKSVDIIANSNYQAEANINQTPHVLPNGARYLQQEKDLATTRQGLLQLAWKNGLPLFMLSYGDSDILVATVRKRDISDKDDLESTYAIFTVEEPKKKSGTWISGGKNKKHQLVSSIVGEMNVARIKSRCNSTKNVHVCREFVLVCSELLPASEESGDSHVNRELAAFISSVPQQAETPCQSSSQISQKSSLSSCCCCPSLGNIQPSVKNSCTHSASVIAILPNGFHGTSISGQPLPLIERWKSGGACDCGGWDEGCMLSVLTDSNHEEKGGIQANQALDGSQRFEFLVQVCIYFIFSLPTRIYPYYGSQLIILCYLHLQGRSREDRHAFIMVSFKEGLYTVEFRSSIALLQAFAMCIVTLHGRYPSRMQVGSQASQDHDLLAQHELKTAASQSKVPTSYVPKRPPLSPVGRVYLIM
jgi:hypothetical protein